jgi:Uma2 family endonuclease
MTATAVTEETIELPPWPEDVVPPPSDLPYDDGERMESPWHNGTATLLVAGYLASRDGRFDDFYAGINMFLYYSSQQVRNRDYKGPDVFFVKNVDGTRERLYWAIWDEEGRYPNVIFELLSPSTESTDLNEKKQLYEEVFRTPEYFCIAPQVKRMYGWRLEKGIYVPIQADERGWLWSEELGLWIGRWDGLFLNLHATWARFYHPSGELVLIPEEAERQRAEAERQRAEAERQRADDLAARMSALEAELQRLRGEQP